MALTPAQIHYYYYSGGGAPALFVSNAGSGDESGSSEDNAMSFDTWKTQFQAGTLSGTFYFNKGEVYDFSDFDTPAPTTQCSNLQVTYTTHNEQIVNVGRGGGDMWLLAARKNAAVTWEPTNDTQYHIHDVVDTDTFIAFVGAGDYEIVSLLEAGTDYHYKAWEFNTNDNEFKFMLTGAPTTSMATWTTNLGEGIALATAQGWEIPEHDVLVAYNTILKDAIDKGIMAQAPRFYLLYSNLSSDYDDWRSINWKSPSTDTQFSPTGGVTFVEGGGVDFNGTTGYGSLQWVPSTQGGGLFLATDAGAACHISANRTLGRVPFGIWKGSTGPANFHLAIGAVNTTGRLNNLNTTGQVSEPNVTYTGLFIAEVRALNTVYMSVDDTEIFSGTATGAGVAVPNVDFVIGARHNAADVTVIDSFFDGVIDFFIPYKATSVDRADIKAWWANAKQTLDAL